MRIRGTVFDRMDDVGDAEANIDQDALKGLFSQSKTAEKERARAISPPRNPPRRPHPRRRPRAGSSRCSI